VSTELKVDRTAVQSLVDIPIKMGVYYRYIKRPLDFILSLFALIVLSPLFIVVSIFVRVKLGSPIFFRQQRPGKDEKIFTMYKFRSMTNGKDENGEFLPDSNRLEKFGRLLRSTSIDELPELINIIKGDMSIVGPRPLLVQYLPLYNTEQRHRHDVRPGLTGLAQVSGRNAIDWDDKFYFDIQYVKKITFLSDCKIVLKTFMLVFRRKGISQTGAATTAYYTGNSSTNKEKEVSNV